MKTFCFLMLIVLLSCGKTQSASIGDAAPGVALERWIKGSPFRIAPGTNIYVVEFWATWCPPCNRSIPHITEMQKKYAANGVIILGISDEKVAEVSKFVAGKGDSMNYRVAVDSSKRTFRSWMTSYGESGIPHAFVVGTNGLVLWHGFPDEDLDAVLEKIVSGKFDLERAKNREAGDRLVVQYTSAVSRPNSAEKAAPLGDKILSDFTKDWRIANHLARAILTDPAVRSRDLALALRATTKATELTQNRSADALEMHARALYANGKKLEAIEVQKKCLALSDPEEKAEREKFLAIYEKGASQPKP
jgi:thiol-disulfide isomerase/thioredoxin